MPLCTKPKKTRTAAIPYAPERVRDLQISRRRFPRLPSIGRKGHHNVCIEARWKRRRRAAPLYQRRVRLASNETQRRSRARLLPPQSAELQSMWRESSDTDPLPRLDAISNMGWHSTFSAICQNSKINLEIQYVVGRLGASPRTKVRTFILLKFRYNWLECADLVRLVRRQA